MQPFDWVNVISAEALQQLIVNHVQQQPVKGTSGEKDFEPVCKVFLPWLSNFTWLLTELDPDEGIAFGLCDVGQGFPELGSVLLDEIYEIGGPGGLRMEQDKHFKARMTLSGYARDARKRGFIRA
jgi:hypothetical protein